MAKTAREVKVTKRRREVAAAVIRGDTQQEIADRMGMNRASVSRLANQPQTKLIMSELLQEHDALVRALVGKSLVAIDDAFGAEKYGCSKAGEAVNLGADHFARLAASKRIQELLQLAGQGQQLQQAGTVSWEAVMQLKQRVVEQLPAPEGDRDSQD